jgi:RNA polymerase sigma-70 factor (ECF subfamily)
MRRHAGLRGTPNRDLAEPAARARREAYIGPWLPEPLFTQINPDNSARLEVAESVSLAMLVILETLAVHSITNPDKLAAISVRRVLTL